jgi:hypothetical protein
MATKLEHVRKIRNTRNVLEYVTGEEWIRTVGRRVYTKTYF